MDHAIHIITNMCQFEGWRKVEDGAVDAAVTVCLSSTFYSLKFELGAYIFLCIKGDMDQLVFILGKAQPYVHFPTSPICSLV
jgi:hypothetical protein